jgi:phage-related protein
MAIGKVIGRVAIKVLPDTTEFRDEAASDLRRIQKQLSDVEVKVIPDLDKSEKDKIKAELKKWADALDQKVKISLDLDMNNGDIARSMAALEGLTKKRTAKIAPELDNGAVAKVASGLAALSGVRFVQGMFRNLRQELMSIDLAVPKIGVVTHAIGVLGAMGLSAVGNLFSLSQSLATIGYAGLALPGIFGGIAIGLGTTIAALKDFNTQVPQAAKYMHDLQDVISTNFWEQAAGPIRELVDKLFPILNTKLAETSTALGTFFGNFANSAAEKLLPKLGPMFDYLTQSIGIASGYTDTFVGIIEKLGTVGASYLPSLATWFGNIATQFDGWLEKTGTDGLTKMVDTGIAALKNLGSVLASTGSILKSISQAATAAGGMTLATLADSLRNVAEAAQSPGFQSGLTATLTAAFNMLDQIGAIAGPSLKALVVSMSSNFQKLAPIIGDTVGTAIAAIASALTNPAVAKGLEAMFQGFNDMVHTLAPVMDLVAEKFGVMGQLVGALARNIGTVLAAAIKTMTPLFVSLIEAMLPIVNMLGPLMAKIITALGPVFAVLGDALGRAAKAAQPMFAAFSDLVDLLMPVLKIVATVVGDALVGVFQGLTLVIKGVTNIVRGVIEVFSGLWDILAGIFTLDFSRVGEGIKSVFSGLGDIILGALQTALGAVWAYMNGTVLGFFKGFAVKLLGPIAAPLARFFEPLQGAASKVVTFLKDAWGKISGLFQGGGGAAGIKAAITKPFTEAASVLKGVWDAITSVISTAWKVIQTVIGAAVKVVQTIIGAAFSVIRTVIETHITVWRTIIETAWNVIKSVVSLALTAIKTVITTIWTAISSFFQTSMNGLYFLFKGPWDAISAFLFETMATIQSSLMLVWTTIRTFFEVLLDYFIVRFQLAWEAIRAATAAVFDAIKAVVTVVWDAISTVIKTALDLIESVVKTTWSAIESAITTVVNAIKTVVTSVWNAITSAISSAVNTVKSAVTAAWDAISSTTSSVFNSIKSTASNIWNGIQGIISGVVGSVKSTVSGAWDTVKTTTSNAFNGLKDIVNTAWDKVKTEVSTGVTNAVSKVEELPSKAVSALAGIGSTLANAGAQLIQGFINGIGSKFGDVKNKLGDLTSKLTSWKGPEKLDKVLLTPVGRLIIDGLIQGFADRFTAVRSMLTDLTNEIAGFIGKSMSQQISDALSFAMKGDVATSITADASVAGVNLDRRLGGLERQVTTAARSAASDTKSESKGDVSIGNITIPLEDLAQLQDLEEFLDMLRVRTRQG